MEKIFRGALLFAFVTGFVPGAFALEGKTRMFTELDVFLPASAADGEEVNLKKAAADYVAWGSDSASYTINTPVAFGGRVGAFYTARRVGDIGISLGYISGPSSEVKFTDNHPVIGVSRFDYTRAVSFVRTLLEFKKAYRINEGWTFTPAVGAGMAFGSNKGIVKRSTNYFAGDTVESAAWSGFTWEAASGFAYQMERLELTLAAKYAAFPSYKGDSARGLAKIDWGTVGFSIGLGFGGRGVSTAAKKDYSAISRGDDYSRQNAEVVKQEPVEQESKPEDVEAVRNYGVHNAARYDSYVQFAEDFISQREYVKALKAYDNALGVLAENDVRGIYIWERKGAVLAEQKNYLKAKGYYAFAIKTAKGLGVTDKTVVNAYLGLAYCLAKGGNTPAAIRNYKKAMQLSTNETTKTRIKKTIRELNARSE